MPYSVMVSTSGSNPFGLGSNPSGATNLIMDTILQSLKEHAEKALEYISIVDKETRAKGL